MDSCLDMKELIICFVIVALGETSVAWAQPFGHGGFPNFFSMKQSEHEFHDGIVYPRADLSPLSVQFNDPSLKNYPRFYSSASAVRPLARFKRQTFPEFSELFEKPHLNIFDEGLSNSFEASTSSGSAHDSGDSFTRDQQDDLGSHRPPPKYPPEDHFGNSERLHPLPESNPNFALPLVHEDPHFQPDYFLATFQKPIKKRLLYRTSALAVQQQPDYFLATFQKPIKKRIESFGRVKKQAHRPFPVFFMPPFFFHDGPFGYEASHGFSPLRVIANIRAASQKYSPF
eukprot:TCALIF_01752-PA protein Name:"Protein of unknown function" AED:0.16 eAED:0.16 QI:0/1/0/1/1/1/2/0/285